MNRRLIFFPTVTKNDIFEMVCAVWQPLSTTAEFFPEDTHAWAKTFI
jgi:hypothetical protein